MVQHHALRVAGGAGGVVQRDRLPLVVGQRQRMRRIAAGDEAFVVGATETFPARRQRIVDVDHQRPARQLRQRARHHGAVLAVGQQHLGLAVLQDEGDRGGIEPGVDRAEHGAQSGHRVVRLQHLRNVGCQDRHRIALADTGARESAGEAAGAYQELRVGDPALAMHDRDPMGRHMRGAQQEGDRRQRDVIGRGAVEVLGVDRHRGIPRDYSAACASAAASARAQTAVSWNTAPPAGGAGSSLVSALMPMPPS